MPNYGDIARGDGTRSHVMREIEPTEADVIRRIFQLSAAGHGVKAIAKLLNAEGAPSPRAQCGRSQTWAPTSVRSVLYRPVYRGRSRVGPHGEARLLGAQASAWEAGGGLDSADGADVTDRDGGRMDRRARTDVGGAGDLLQGDGRADVRTTGAREPLEVLADQSGALWVLRGIAQGAITSAWHRAEAVLWLLGVSRAGTYGLRQ